MGSPLVSGSSMYSFVMSVKRSSCSIFSTFEEVDAALVVEGARVVIVVDVVVVVGVGVVIGILTGVVDVNCRSPVTRMGFLPSPPEVITEGTKKMRGARIRSNFGDTNPKSKPTYSSLRGRNAENALGLDNVLLFSRSLLASCQSC